MDQPDRYQGPFSAVGPGRCGWILALQAPVLLRFAARDYQRKTKFLKGLRGPRHHSLRRRRQLRLAGVRTTALGLEVNAIGNLEKKMSSLLKM
jgi:hypothetical protein